VNNVGNTFMTRQMSPDQIEMSLAVNHLASFLLTHLLLDLLKASQPARIVNVGTRLDTAMNLEDLQWTTRKYSGLQAYAQSKLGNLHFTFELATHLKDTKVSVNCVHPGVFQSNLGKSGGPEPLFLRLMTSLAYPFLTPAAKAAERVIYVATSAQLEGVSGKYFGDRVELSAPPQTQDLEVRRRIWQISSQLTHLSKE
jgi:retinol dehydrogenase 13